MLYLRRFSKYISENKDTNTYQEIEFLCHNSDYSDSTNRERQMELYKDLKELQKSSDNKALPYMQDFCDDSHDEYSLAVIIMDDGIIGKVKELSKEHGIEIDLYHDVSNEKVDKIIRGDMYDNLLD